MDFFTVHMILFDSCSYIAEHEFAFNLITLENTPLDLHSLDQWRELLPHTVAKRSKVQIPVQLRVSVWMFSLSEDSGFIGPTVQKHGGWSVFVLRWTAFTLCLLGLAPADLSHTAKVQSTR